MPSDVQDAQPSTATAPIEPPPAPQLPATTEGQEERRTMKLSSMKIGERGITFTNAAEVMAYARMMADSDKAVRPEFRGNPGACLAVIDDAIRFGMSPYALARKAYFVNGQLAYEAQAIAAIIISLAPLKDLPDYIFEGDGGQRTCTVVVTTLTGKVIEHSSPPFAKIDPKNSPLWKTDPDQQLGYYTIRAMSRRHFPHILMGVYDLEEAAAARAADVTPPKDNKRDFGALAAERPKAPEAIAAVRGSGGGNAGDAMPVVPGGAGGGDISPLYSGGGGGAVATGNGNPGAAMAAMEAELAQPHGAPHDIQANLTASAMDELRAALGEAKTKAEVGVVADEFSASIEAMKKQGGEPARLAEVMAQAIAERIAALTPAPAKPKKK